MIWPMSETKRQPQKKNKTQVMWSVQHSTKCNSLFIALELLQPSELFDNPTQNHWIALSRDTQLELSRKSRDWEGPRTVSFGLTGHQTCNWEWKFYKTKYLWHSLVHQAIFGGKVSFILSFLFFLSASTAATCNFTAPSCTTYYNYSWTLCIKCWVSAFHTEI
jgi:hypothetical protein